MNIKNTLIGLGMVGALIGGGYFLFNDNEQPSSVNRFNIDSSKYDTDYSTTRTNLQSGQPDKDCTDFTTHARAQSFFKSQGPGDPHGLDRDGDGIACETLP